MQKNDIQAHELKYFLIVELSITHCSLNMAEI